MNAHSGSFAEAIRRLQYFAVARSGGTMSQASAKAKALVGLSVQNQAFVQAVDDVFLIAAFTLVFALVPVFFLRGHRRRNAKRSLALE